MPQLLEATIYLLLDVFICYFHSFTGQTNKSFRRLLSFEAIASQCPFNCHIFALGATNTCHHNWSKEGKPEYYVHSSLLSKMIEREEQRDNFLTYRLAIRDNNSFLGERDNKFD